MAIQYTWNITQLSCYPEKDGVKDVIFSISWTLLGVDGDYKTSIYGTQSIAQMPSVLKCSCDGMSFDDAITLLKESMGADGVAEQEAIVAARIEDLKKPPVVNPPLPWEVQK